MSQEEIIGAIPAAAAAAGAAEGSGPDSRLKTPAFPILIIAKKCLTMKMGLNIETSDVGCPI
ncbi:MAG: hypothetical protein P8X90_00400 [Desulfobacterales bacterium]